MTRIVIAVIAAALWATAVFAAGESDFGRALLSRIESEGYRISSVKTTWLGRVQIDSRNSANRRQTVYNPVNDAILQDVVVPIGGDSFLDSLAGLLQGDVRARRKKDKGADAVTLAPTRASGNNTSAASVGGGGTASGNTGGGGDSGAGGHKGKSGGNNGKSSENNGKSGGDNGKSGGGQGKGKNGGKGNKK